MISIYIYLKHLIKIIPSSKQNNITYTALECQIKLLIWVEHYKVWKHPTSHSSQSKGKTSKKKLQNKHEWCVNGNMAKLHAVSVKSPRRRITQKKHTLLSCHRSAMGKQLNLYHHHHIQIFLFFFLISDFSQTLTAINWNAL